MRADIPAIMRLGLRQLEGHSDDGVVLLAGYEQGDSYQLGIVDRDINMERMGGKH